MRQRVLVVGLGNLILTDDGVGVWVVRALEARLDSKGQEVSWAGDQRHNCDRMEHPLTGVVLREASVGGVRLLEVLCGGYDRVILVDAIQTPGGTPGAVYHLRPADLARGPSLHVGSSHDLSFPGALALGRRMGMPLPDDEGISIIAVEVSDVLTFGESCTPSVAAAIPRVAEAVVRELIAGCPARRVGNEAQ